jgi:hypothetical protein
VRDHRVPATCLEPTSWWWVRLTTTIRVGLNRDAVLNRERRCKDRMALLSVPQHSAIHPVCTYCFPALESRDSTCALTQAELASLSHSYSGRPLTSSTASSLRRRVRSCTVVVAAAYLQGRADTSGLGVAASPRKQGCALFGTPEIRLALFS